MIDPTSLPPGAASSGSSPRPRPSKGPVGLALPAAALLLFAINLAFKFPGQLNFDALNQLDQLAKGRLDDWHPPIMAMLWGALMHIAPGPSGMLVLQLCLQWFGLWMIADGFATLERPRSALLVLACGASPLLLTFNGQMLSDLQMVSALLAAFGLVFRARTRQLRVAPAVALACVLLAYAVLVRTNAVFLLGPFLFYFFAPRLGLARVVLLSAVVSVLAIPLSGLINHELLRAERSGVERSLMIFDITGTAHYSKDSVRLQQLAEQPQARVDPCYTSYYWDNFSYWGPCKKIWEGVADSERHTPGATTKAWIGSMTAHPGAYLRHRLAQFNSMLYFLVPANHVRFMIGIDGQPPPAEQVRMSMPQILADTVKTALFWPFAWLLLDAALLWLLVTRSVSFDRAPGAAQALLLSGLFYTLAYLPIGVATNLRYHLWLELSVQISLIALGPQLWRLILLRHRPTLAWCALIALSLLAALACRLADSTAFIT